MDAEISGAFGSAPASSEIALVIMYVRLILKDG
jgi:hypothetical protein